MLISLFSFLLFGAAFFGIFFAVMSGSQNQVLISVMAGLIGGILISMAIGIGDKGRKSDEINSLIVLILLFIAMTYMMFMR